MRKLCLFTAVLFFSTAVFSLDLHSEYSHIYSDEDGSAHLLNFSVNGRLKDERKNLLFAYDLNYNNLNSSHNEINGQVESVNFSTSLGTPYFTLKWHIGAFDSSKLALNLDYKITNDGGQGLYTGLESVFNVQQLQLKAFCFYGYSNFREGDMAYFMGHPDLPYFLLAGAELEYQKNLFQLIYLPFKMDILTNDSKELFTSRNHIVGAFYSRDFNLYSDRLQFKLQPFAAYYFANGNLNGALTQQNQQVIYFVFDYFKIDAAYAINTILLGCNANLKYKFCKLNFDSALIFLLSEKAEFNLAWKKLDKLAEWQEELIWNSLSLEKEGSQKNGYDKLDKAGLLLFNLGADFSLLNNHLEINLNKRIFIPFTLNNEGKEEGTSYNQANSSLVKNILLSGLSFGLTIRY